MTISNSKAGKIQPLSVLLYGLAGLSLLAAILMLVYGFTVEYGIQASTLFLQGVLGPMGSQLIAILTDAIRFALFGFAAVLFLASVLLFTSGRNVLKVNMLSERLAELESRLEKIEAGAK